MRATAILAAGIAAAIWAVPVAGAEPTTVAPPEVPLDDTRTVFTDTPDLVDPRPMRIESWSRIDAGEVVAVHFTSGTPQCYGVHAEVQETAETVTVELSGGTRPEAVGRACIAIAVFGTLEVPLQSPIADRQLLNTY